MSLMRWRGLADEPAFDLVLLNAGISATERFEEVSLERMERVVAVCARR